MENSLNKPLSKDRGFIAVRTLIDFLYALGTWPKGLTFIGNDVDNYLRRNNWREREVE